ncbi:MAG: glycosyltransferase family 2 protein [Candidatus Rokubacteria bacterium]|nr:glycosyltransferase family 2 protein [Candidatus Rokubacteria bacterium]
MPAPAIRKLTVVIPAYNEEATIADTIERVKTAEVGPLDLEIIVVDDGSRDRTREILSATPGIRTVFHERNRGKGGAVKTGFRAATGDVLLIQDADLEYDPSDYKTVLQPILEGRVEAVMGSRFVFERPHFFFGEAKSPFFTHYVGNLTIIVLTNLLYGNAATDYEGGYKAFTKRLVDSIPIEADGFEYDNELICKLLRRGHRIEEVPISYRPRTYEHGKKIAWTDGLRMVWTILKWRFRRF